MRRDPFRCLTTIFFFFLTYAATPASGQDSYCYRLKCDQSQRCAAEQAGSGGGKCCCKVECCGGQGGIECVCTTWCDQGCGAGCPNCNLCGNTESRSTAEGFRITAAAADKIRQQNRLAGLLVSLFSDRFSHPVYSLSAEGFSNAGTGYDYAYRVRVEAQPEKLIMDFVFAPSHPESGVGGPPPEPVRITVDAQGNITSTPLSPEDVAQLRGVE